MGDASQYLAIVWKAANHVSSTAAPRCDLGRPSFSRIHGLSWCRQRNACAQCMRAACQAYRAHQGMKGACRRRDVIYCIKYACDVGGSRHVFQHGASALRTSAAAVCKRVAGTGTRRCGVTHHKALHEHLLADAPVVVGVKRFEDLHAPNERRYQKA